MSGANEGFVLIGAGLGRTGTNSTRQALVQLLGGDCYHGFTLCARRREHQQHWRKALRGEASGEDWRELLKDYKAGLDTPINLFYKELMEIFPDAKVLLTVRDPVEWYVSMRNTLARIKNNQKRWPYSWFRFLRGTQILYDLMDKQKAVDAVNAGEQSAVKFYEDHVKEVMEHVPEDRLLVWNVKEGWGPLCEFLDVPQPEQPFPWSNDTKAMQRLMKVSKVIYWLMVLFLQVWLAVVGFVFSEDPWMVIILGLTGLVLVVVMARMWP